MLVKKYPKTCGKISILTLDSKINFKILKKVYKILINFLTHVSKHLKLKNYFKRPAKKAKNSNKYKVSNFLFRLNTLFIFKAGVVFIHASKGYTKKKERNKVRSNQIVFQTILF